MSKKKIIRETSYTAAAMIGDYLAKTATAYPNNPILQVGNYWANMQKKSYISITYRYVFAKKRRVVVLP